MAVWSIPRFSKLPDLRYDPEYYQPSNLELTIKLAAVNPAPISEFADVTDGIHGSPDWVEAGGITYLSAKCVKDNYFVLDAAGQVSQEQNRLNPRTQARINDVLLTTVGTIGNAAVVYDDILPANMDRHLGIIRIRDSEKVDPYYLATFLNCKYGRFQSLRDATGNVQLNLFIAKIKRLLVPTGDSFNEIGKLTRKAYSKILESQSMYPEAEAEMLDRMGWNKLIKQPSPLHYIQRFSGTQLADRIDSEHFKPQYKRIHDHLQKIGSRPLGRLIQPLTNGFDCREWQEDGTPYIRVGDIQKGEISDECQRVEALPEEVLKDVHLQTGDVLFARKGTYGRTGIVHQKHETWIISSEIMRLRLNDNVPVVPEYLSLFLESQPGFLQVEQRVHGVSNFSISQRDMKTILIYLPKNNKGEIDLKWQEKLAEKVIAASRAKVEAQAMLEKAKRMVEEAIEQEFAKSQTN
ncbi:MAG: restriction endonuclease subunit S [Oscillatoriales cyanobacterium C42_A2020_001]|nr:restriction endonuclease subunit S [Leptolyngbyaceae cyanobacterium C42_A2020_001]